MAFDWDPPSLGGICPRPKRSQSRSEKRDKLGNTPGAIEKPSWLFTGHVRGGLGRRGSFGLVQGTRLNWKRCLKRREGAPVSRVGFLRNTNVMLWKMTLFKIRH